MAEEVQIIRIDTGDAIRNVGELKEYIKDLKKSLDDTDKSFEENAKDAEALRAAQAELRDAMYATTTSAEDLLKASDQLYDENGKLTGSYNDLVKQMAALKSAWRATTDEATRTKLGDQIDKINSELKTLDASVGNFQRNVGNYGSALNGLSDILKGVPPTLGPLKKSLGDVGQTLDILGKQPVLGIVGLLAPVVMKLTSALKENNTALDAGKKVLDALKPVTDFFGKIMETIAGWISKAADYIADLLPKAVDSFGGIIKGAVGVGNAIVQYLLTPVKTVIEAVKGLGHVIKDVFSGDFSKAKEDAAAALQSIGDAFKDGFSFKKNYERGQEMAEEFIAGMASPSAKKKAGNAGKSIASEVAKGIDEGFQDIDMDKVFDEVLKGIEKAEGEANKIAEDAAKKRLDMTKSYADYRKQVAELTIDDEAERAEKVREIERDALQKRLDLLQQFQQDAYGRGDIDAALAYDQQIADARVAIELDELKEKKRLRDEDTKNAAEEAEKRKKTAEAEAKARIQIMNTVASATSGILGSIADLYEQNAGESAEAANRVKGIRIAASTIDTISGAIAAYVGAVESVPGPAGIVLGALQAATVTAAGLANIAKMKATQVPGASSSTSVSTPEPSAFVSAPTVSTDVASVRNITSASEEDRLNKMASKQKVYLVTSELEADQEDTRVTLDEASW